MAADGDGGGGGDGGDSVAMSIPEISEMFWGGGVMKDAVSPLHGPALTDMVGAQHARIACVRGGGCSGGMLARGNACAHVCGMPPTHRTVQMRLPHSHHNTCTTLAVPLR